MTPAGTATASRTGRRRRLTLIGALYCTQNLSLGFFVFAFLTIAQARGVPLASIGAAASLATLLALKFLWAPLVDRFGSARLGHYRGWLIVTQTALGAGLAALALFDPARDFHALLAVFAVIFALAATQDIAADAAATRILRPEERGLGNGLQSAGSCVAQVVGGGAILVVYQLAGWQTAALVLSAFSLIALPLILAWREDEDTAAQPAPRVTLRSALGFFRSPSARLWCLLTIPAYAAGFTIAYNLLRPMLVDAGWSEARIGLYVVIGGSGVGILTGLAAGALIVRLGRRRALVHLGVLQVLATAATVPVAFGFTQSWLVLVVVALANGAFAAAFAIIFTISMDLTRPESAGTDFTLFSTAAQLVMVLAAALGISAAGAFGYAPVALAAVLIAAGGLLLAVRTFRAIDLGADPQRSNASIPTPSKELR